MKRWKEFQSPVAALACLGVGVAAMVVAAGEREREREKAREVTVKGRVVDLYSFMTGKYESSDKAACTRDRIQSGVPAVLETEDGLIVLGQGPKGPQKTLARVAFQTAEVKGTLHERDGIRYLDILHVNPVDAAPKEKPKTPGDEDDMDREDDEQDSPEGMGSGACCLSGGECIRTSLDSCDSSGGEFYEGSTCEEIECGTGAP